MAGAGGPHSANSPCNLSRSLDRILSDAQATCELKLSGRKLKEYPKGAAKYNLSDTVVADLSKNRFSEIPGEVTDYASLEQLSLYQNVIKNLPESVASLQSLTHLNLSRNQLSTLPGCVCALGALRVLDVSGNRLVSLPEEVGHLQSLMDLDASYNHLAHLPPALGELNTLKRLNLRRNLLQSLPAELCFLRLVLMDLSSNRIATLPTELRFMSSLVTLTLDNNPLQHPPANLCTRGRVHIFKWLEMAAAKEDKKRGILTTEIEFRKLQLRKPSSCTDFREVEDSPSEVTKENLEGVGSSPADVGWSVPLLRSVVAMVVVVLVTYDYYKMLRFVNGFFDPRHKRSTMDSGYSTCESVDQRWSQESQESLEYEDPRKLAVRAAACTKEQRQERGRSGPPSRPVNGIPNGGISPGMNGSQTNIGQGVNGSGYGTQQTGELATSGLSTPSTLSPGDGFNLEDEFNKALKMRQDYENIYGNDHSPIKENQSNSGAIWNVGSSSHSSSHSSSNSNHSSSSNGGITLRHPPEPPHPHNPDPGGGYIPPNHPSSQHSHAHVPTYREYVEAKLQKRAMENNNIYRRQADGSAPSAENGTHRSVENLSHRTDVATHPRPNPMGASKPCNGLDGYSQRLPSQPRPQDLSREDMTRADVKTIQKEAVLSYIKSRVSPSKGSSSNSPDVSFDSGDGSSYPASHTNPSHPQHTLPHANYSSSPYPSQTINYAVSAPQVSSTPYTSSSSNLYSSTGHHTSTLPPQTTAGTYTTRGSTSSLPKAPTTVKARKRSGGGRPFDPDSSPAHLSFTYRRELEKQQHEKQLIENLRNIIETRLKVSLPADMSAALMDGVVLCHLANHVRPRSVSSIHVPSPAVPKLTIAKCRLNVENFLEACRKIGVEDEYTCTAHDILEERGTVRVAITVERLLQFYQGRHTPMSPRNQTPV
ncbi:LOW QUALITY PROTEIN: leucine-rich repeat and calponin homology domain-containing protein-like [Homarus americanus]|uniref:LOW QUALITY PROTEIN: leucine-rich repeat and calponin homology domain-containing protein-like n=1 Tax=Homarus americanus TaxID=6706 RepID=UPI001C4624E8|nr:LOW QUALITY PROTEIN: leucine-rich repeat and calponin homology domain-containing protein-like [Homarus americanus]